MALARRPVEGGVFGLVQGGDGGPGLEEELHHVQVTLYARREGGRGRKGTERENQGVRPRERWSKNVAGK